MGMNEAFRRLSARSAEAIGSSWAFVLACALIFSWALTGPVFGFSDTWQLVVNTGSSLVTFLAVFLIQNTQNRDAKAIHLKLDELLRSVEGARTGLVNLEELPDAEIEHLSEDFRRLHDEEHDGLELEVSREPNGSTVAKATTGPDGSNAGGEEQRRRADARS